MQADIGIGFLIATFVGYIFDIPITPYLVLFSVLIALLPDIDFLVEYAERGRVGGKVIGAHRELLHFPILYIIPIAFSYFFVSEVASTIFLLGILCHFLHDTIGIGWGIKWLWPFSTRSYKFFSDRTGRPSKKFIHSWSAEEMPEVAREYGIENWISDIYLHPFSTKTEYWLKVTNFIEWGIFLFGSIILLRAII